MSNACLSNTILGKCPHERGMPSLAKFLYSWSVCWHELIWSSSCGKYQYLFCSDVGDHTTLASGETCPYWYGHNRIAKAFSSLRFFFGFWFVALVFIPCNNHIGN